MQGSTHAGLSATMPHIQCQLALFTHKHAMGRCRRQLNGLGPQALGASGAPWGLQSRGPGHALGRPGVPWDPCVPWHTLGCPAAAWVPWVPWARCAPLRFPGAHSQSSRVSRDPIGPFKVSWGSLGGLCGSQGSLGIPSIPWDLFGSFGIAWPTARALQSGIILESPARGFCPPKLL